MCSPEPAYRDGERRLLLALAQRSIAHGLANGCPLPVDPERHPEKLRALRASFVSLYRAGQLRGCVGSLEARRPLVVDVAQSAFQAAFHDPRFAPLEAHELQDLAVQISVLSPLELLDAGSEEAVVQGLRPGVDGLLLREGACQGTLLPAVWASVPEPRSFVREVKRKAGLPPDHWSPAVVAYRYTAESIG